MALHVNSDELKDLKAAIIAALGLPKNLRSFEIRIAVDEIVVVKCEYYQEGIDVDGVKKLELLAGAFQLVKVEP
jgi:hypothetical protein